MRDTAADLATVLEAAGLGLARPPTGTNLFLGDMPEQLDDSGTANDVAALCVAILQTGGGTPNGFVGGTSESYRPVACQVTVRSPANDFQAGQTLALQVFDALHLRDDVSPYTSITVREGAPVYWGPKDAAGRRYWTMNVVAEYLDDGTAGTPISLPDSGDRTVSGNLTVTGNASVGGTLTVTGALAAANFSGTHSGTSSGTNTGDLTLAAALGSSPNAAGLSLSGQVLTAQPADATRPGMVTAGAQTFGGAKTFGGGLVSDSLVASGTATLVLTGAPTDGASAIGATLGSTTALANSAAKPARFLNGTEKAYLEPNGCFTVTGATAGQTAIRIPLGAVLNFGPDSNGIFLRGVTGGPIDTGTDFRAAGYVRAGQGFLLDFQDTSGTPGNASVTNRSAGRSAIASGASAMTLTNNLVTANSVVLCAVETAGAGVCALVPVPTAGSVTFTAINGTGVVTTVSSNLVFRWLVIRAA